METSLALTIIGSVLILVGVIFNVIPKVVNQKTMGDLAEEAVNPAAALRTVIGGSELSPLDLLHSIAVIYPPNRPASF